MKIDLEVEVEVDLRLLGKVIIFRVKQNLPIIYRLMSLLLSLLLLLLYYHFFIISLLLSIEPPRRGEVI